MISQPDFSDCHEEQDRPFLPIVHVRTGIAEGGRTLETIRELICEHYQDVKDAERFGMAKAQLIGDLLLEAQIQLRRQPRKLRDWWKKHVEQNYPFGVRMACDYLYVSKNWHRLNSEVISELTSIKKFKEAVRKLEPPKPVRTNQEFTIDVDAVVCDDSTEEPHTIALNCFESVEGVAVACDDSTEEPYTIFEKYCESVDRLLKIDLSRCALGIQLSACSESIAKIEQKIECLKAHISAYSVTLLEQKDLDQVA